MKIKEIILSMILLISIGCKSQFRNDNSKTIKIYDVTYGKQAFMQNELDLLSRITNIQKKYLGTSIYALYEGKRIEIPINDEHFNYEVFGKNLDAFKNKNAKLYIQKYEHKGKDYFIAVKIE